MQTNKTNNIIFLKDVESNIIDEAIVILKDNIKLNDLKEEKNNIINKDINILKEAEIFINQKINMENIKLEKYKTSKMQKKIKKLKILNIVLLLGTILIFLIK